MANPSEIPKVEELSVDAPDLEQTATEMETTKMTPKTYLLKWMNGLLESDFTSIEELHTGITYCQLMDMLHPGSVDMENLIRNPEIVLDCKYNFQLLKESFEKVNIKKIIRIEQLINADVYAHTDLLKFFKRQFTEKNGNAEAGGLHSATAAEQPKSNLAAQPSAEQVATINALNAEISGLDMVSTSTFTERNRYLNKLNAIKDLMVIAKKSQEELAKEGQDKEKVNVLIDTVTKKIDESMS